MSTTNPLFSSMDDIMERFLALDFHRDLVQDSNDSLKTIQKRIKWHSPLKPLPSKITNVNDYHSSFFSLFMVECLEILTQSKYTDLTMPLLVEPISCNISGVFGYVTFTSHQSLPNFSPGDLVLLHIVKNQLGPVKRDHANNVVKSSVKEEKLTGPNSMNLSHTVYEDSIKHCLGYLSSIVMNKVVVQILILPPKFATPETFDTRDLDRLESIQNKLSSIYSNSKVPHNSLTKNGSEDWYISRLLSLTTILREFKGLCMLDKMPLRDALLTEVPENKKNIDPDECNELLLDLEIPLALKKTIEANYNSGQIAAVSNSLKNTGISLIQGPPGTGKTNTIMGIVSVILHSTTPIEAKRNEVEQNHLNKDKDIKNKNKEKNEETKSKENKEKETKNKRTNKDKDGNKDRKDKDDKNKKEGTYKRKQEEKDIKKERNENCGNNRDNNTNNIKRKGFWYYEEDESDEENMSFDEFLSGERYNYCSNFDYNIYDSFNSQTVKNPNILHLGSEKQSNRRILICAPSNAAIDEIVKRLVSPDGGIYDSNGNKYNPTVTRVGPNYHEDLKEYSLETKVNKWLSKNNLSFIKGDRTSASKRPTIIMDILLNSEIVCSTLSGCGSRELYGLLNCFDTLIVDEATQAVELSTLIPFNLGCKRAILVGDPCQLSATVCSKVAIQLNYDQSLFKRLQMCGYPVNFLKLQYRMDPMITRFPSMYFYQNQLINAKRSISKPEDDWRLFPLLRPTVFFALDSQESRSDTSYVNEMEVDMVCQLLEIVIEILSSVPGITAEDIANKIAVISPYAAQAEILKATIIQRIKIIPTSNSTYKTLTGGKTNQIYVSTVDGFQGMEKDIIIFSAVRTNYMGNKKALHARIQDLTAPSILTIDTEPHDIKQAAKFSKLSAEYLDKISKKTPDLTTNVIDASFIADRRRINVAITRACSNLLIVGNPRYLLDHKHWSALYNHYAKTGSIFICKTVNNQLDPNFLRKWSVDYLNRAPEQRRKLLKNKYLKDFVTKLMS